MRRYLSRVSMPLLDRIDMCVEAGKVKYEELTGEQPGESSARIRERVTRAADVQAERYKGSRFRFNADLNPEGVRKYCSLDAECRKAMHRIYERMGLTARSYTRILKVARTIADMEGSKEIRLEHLTEAVSFRAIDRKYWEKVL